MSHNHTDSLLIEPASKPVNAHVRVPGSKSFTNRALAIAALAEGTSRLSNVLDSEDTQVMMDSLGRLGIRVEHDAASRTAIITGCGGHIPSQSGELFLANSGTSIRFLTALVALGTGRYLLDGVARMRQRPIGDLLDALEQLGVRARAVNKDRCPPVEIEANGLPGGTVHVRGDVSSQFLSALLIAAPYASGPLDIRVDGELVSKPYIDMTLASMQSFGVAVRHEGHRVFHFDGRSRYRACEYPIEPDASTASYFFGAAAVTGGAVVVDGLGRDSLQGDLRFVHELERMGCRVSINDSSTAVQGGQLHGIDTDMRDISDTVPTLAAVACFADSPTRIRGVAHIRVKETDRIAAVVTELRKTGLLIDEFEDGMVIHPGPMQSAEFDTYDDHRMAMGLAVLGLRVPGIRIRDPGCTVKTYPGFFADFAALVR